MLAADAALLAAAAVWGSTFVIVAGALRLASPLLFVAVRFTLAALLLSPIALIRHGVPDRNTLRAGAEVGLWLFLGFALQTVGLVWTPPARAAFLTGLYVVLVPFLLVVVYRRAPTAASLAGVVLATAGLALLAGPAERGSTRGDLAVLASALAFAFQILSVDRYARSVGVVGLLFVELGTVSLAAWPAAFLLETPRLPARGSIWAALAVTSLLATLGALWAQNWAQRVTSPTRAAVLLAMEPVFAAAVSYWITGERFTLRGGVGCCLILCGMLAAELLPRPSRRST